MWVAFSSIYSTNYYLMKYLSNITIVVVMTAPGGLIAFIRSYVEKSSVQECTIGGLRNPLPFEE